MQYPLISEYVRAIQDAGDNLGELAHLVPVLDNHGEPYRSSGAFAVVFKMKDEQMGRLYALKCFTEEQEGRAEAYRQIADELECVASPYLTSVRYLDKELFVDSSCEEEEFPVLLMDWVDGETMETYIAANHQDEYAMAMLCYRFCKMAAWLRSQPFAHGDIKPDNIMVRPEGSLTLVDYDGMFVPTMTGQKSPTIGTKDFSHPLRTVDDFDETIDDFALASIALSLKAISLKPSLLDEYGASDRLLFSANDYLDLSKSKVVTALLELMNDEEMKTLYSLFLLASAKKSLKLSSFILFCEKKSENHVGEMSFSTDEVISTKVAVNDFWDDVIIDEYGVKYSKDGKRLLKASKRIKGSYTIKEGTKVICDDAFSDNCSLSNLVMPNSVTSIGSHAFYGCKKLCKIVTSIYVTNIGSHAFCGCKKLHKLVIPNCITKIGVNAFSGCDSLYSIVIPKGVNQIEAYTFSGCKSLFNIEIPDNVIKIGNFAFQGCKSLEKIVIPDSTMQIGACAFWGCKSLKELVVPSKVVNIGFNPFANWSGQLRVLSSNYVYDDGVLFDKEKKTIIAFRNNVKTYAIPDSVTTIGVRAFRFCKSLVRLDIPDSVLSIEDYAFRGCESLISLVIPNSVKSVGNYAFEGCKSMSSIIVSDNVLCIGKAAFRDCKSLSCVSVPKSVSCIGNRVFENCNSLCSIIIPDNVSSIGEYAFHGCEALSKLIMPSSIRSIGPCAFKNCTSLSVFIIPENVESVGDMAFLGCSSFPLSLRNDIITRFGEKAILQ